MRRLFRLFLVAAAFGPPLSLAQQAPGGDDRADVDSLFLQPFLSKALGQGRTLTLNSESTYDFEGESWNVPVNLLYSQGHESGQPDAELRLRRALLLRDAGRRTGVGLAVRGDLAVPEIAQRDRRA